MSDHTGDETITVTTTRGEIRIRAELFDSCRGEQFGAVIARDPAGRLAAYLDYSLFEGAAHVQSPEIAPDLRRQGLAPAMRRALRRAYPNRPFKPHGIRVISLGQ